MMIQPSAHSPVRFVGVIALLAASVIGAVYLQATSLTGTIVAECFDGQTVDPATGTCPTQPSTANDSKELASNPAVQDANGFDMPEEDHPEGLTPTG